MSDIWERMVSNFLEEAGDTFAHTRTGAELSKAGNELLEAIQDFNGRDSVQNLRATNADFTDLAYAFNKFVIDTDLPGVPGTEAGQIRTRIAGVAETISEKAGVHPTSTGPVEEFFADSTAAVKSFLGMEP